MPIYEYHCDACGHDFEELQKITAKPIKVCEKCGKRKVRRLISLTSFQLKGGGWYADLYGSSSSKAGTSSSSSSSSSTAPSPSKSAGAGNGTGTSTSSSSGNGASSSKGSGSSKSSGSGKSAAK